MNGVRAQRRFVRALAKVVVDKVMNGIDTKQIPAEWTGHELRMLLAELFAQETRLSKIKQHPHRAAAKAYRNTRKIQAL